MTVPLSTLLEQAGFSGQSEQIMAGIVMAESGGNPRAYGGPPAEPNDNSYGLAQINMIGSLGPAREQSFHLNSYDDLYDPETNLRAAFQLSNGGTNFEPWTTFTSGKYQSLEAEGMSAQIPTSGVSTLASSTSSLLPAPPYPVTRDSSGWYYVTVGGKKYGIKDKFYGNPNADDNVPVADILVMGKYLRQVETLAKANPKDTALSTANTNIIHSTVKAVVDSGSRKSSDLTSIVYQYTKIVQPPKSAGSLPGSGAVADLGTSLGNIISFLTSAKNWKRIGLFALGALIIIVAVMYTLNG